MSWTPPQWDAFAALVAAAWPGAFDEATRAAWRILLDDLEPDVAAAVLKRLVIEGHTFRPSASEFYAATRRDPSRPTFDEALVLIRRALTATVETAGALGRLAGQPLVRAFLERQGVARVRMLPLDCPDWGEKTRRELREGWDRHVEAFEGREVAALASGRADGLRQLDPLTALGVDQTRELTR